MLIKASRIINLTDARYFAAREVDFLGFNLEAGTEGYLDPIYMKAIREWVEGPRIVGEFSRTPAPYIREAAAFFGLDAVQVTTAYASHLAELEGLTVILTVDAGAEVLKEDLFQKAAPYVAYFLLKMPAGSFDPELNGLLRKVCAVYPVLLETDAPAEAVSALAGQLQPAGLSLTGGEEEQVGVKSFDEIEAIFEALGK